MWRCPGPPVWRPSMTWRRNKRRSTRDTNLARSLHSKLVLSLASILWRVFIIKIINILTCIYSLWHRTIYWHDVLWYLFVFVLGCWFETKTLNKKIMLNSSHWITFHHIMINFQNGITEPNDTLGHVNVNMVG